MSEARPNPVARFLPSLTDLAFIMPLVFLFGRATGAKYLLGDGDTGWHVRTGEWILAHGHVPHYDVFSFSKAGQPWFAWEWLWDVVFACIHHIGGLAAVAIVSMVLLCLTFALLFRLTRRHCPNPLIAIGLTLMATAGSAMHWLARPHLFTLFFTVIFCWVLESARDGRARALILLPFLMVLWTNLHGGFFVGIILIGGYAAGEFASWLVEAQADERRAALARSKPYVLAALGCVAASFLNPYTYHLHVHMYRFLSGSFHLQYIEEYQSTSFQTILAFWYEPMLVLGLIAAAWSLYRRRFAHAFVVAGWAHLGLFSVRNMPIYLLVAAPVVATMLHELLALVADARVAGWLRKRAKDFTEYAAGFDLIDRIPRVYLASAATAVVLAAAFYTPNPPWLFRAEYDPQKYPAGALQVLRSSEVAGNVFTPDEWGDYLIYHLYPIGGRVFVDGRFDFYGAEFTEKYINMANMKYGWEETLRRYGIGTILLPVDASMAGALKVSSVWHTIYDDGVSIVFRNATMKVRAASTGSERSSAVNRGGGIYRDRRITTTQQGDPRITQPNTRSEPL